MFREMRRFKQQISADECAAVLKNETRGVLSLLGDDGYPYGIPMNHYYCEEDGKLYFHGAKEGHKIDSLKRCDKVCYTVYDKGYRREGEWSLNVKSVVVFGRISLVENEEKQLTSAQSFAENSPTMKTICAASLRMPCRVFSALS